MVNSDYQNQEQLFFTGKDYFAALANDLATAKTAIDIETYIFAQDKLGKKFLELLINAAKNGVKVRVLVDGAGTSLWYSKQIRTLEQAGGETRIYHPFPWQLWHWSRSHVHAPSLLKAIYLLLKINKRNHRKVCIIDKRVAYIGSFNITAQHLDKNSAGYPWRDTGVRLQHTDLTELIKAFESVWNHTPIQERIKYFFRHIRTNPIIRLNNTWHRRRILYKNLLTRIKNCSKRIWITNAYFVPDNFLLRRLVEAAKRGIDVRILLPEVADVAFMPWASNAFYKSLLKAGVRIFEYLPNMLHAKTLIIDNWMLIGSSNMNHRSLLHDLEVDVNIRLSASKIALEQQFLKDTSRSQEIKLADWQKRHWYQNLIGKLLLYLKYMI